MRKIVLVLGIFGIILILFPVFNSNEKSVSGDDEVQVIPDEAIRLRILANSDSEKDQAVKRLVRDEVNKHISAWVKDITDIDEARALISERVPELIDIAEEVLRSEGKDQSLDVSYEKDVTFPTKKYGPYIYPAGEYEAVLISIGEAEGANWWCVLFPPLCFLDFENNTTADETEDELNGEAKEDTTEEDEEVEVKFFLFEWFGWT